VSAGLLTAAREARRRSAWREAYDLFREAYEQAPLETTLEAEGGARREVQLKGLSRPIDVASVSWR
jgi:hypothetical protein